MNRLRYEPIGACDQPLDVGIVANVVEQITQVPDRCDKCGQEHWGPCTTEVIMHEDGSVTGGEIIR